MTTPLATPASFWSRVNVRVGDCWLWTGQVDKDGYGRIDYQHHHWRGAHRVVWMLTHGGAFPTQFVLHHCDNPPCVRPDHLFLGDAGVNARDRQAKGRSPKHIGATGPDHHHWWTTLEMVEGMRAWRAQGFTLQSIAERFGVSPQHVSRMVRGVLPANTHGRAS